MPEFKSREEYEDWKARRFGNTEKPGRERHHDPKTIQQSGGQTDENALAYPPPKTNLKVVTTVGLLLLVVSILLYTTTRKGSKSDILQETKKTSKIIQEKKTHSLSLRQLRGQTSFGKQKRQWLRLKLQRVLAQGFSSHPMA